MKQFLELLLQGEFYKKRRTEVLKRDIVKSTISSKDRRCKGKCMFVGDIL